MSENHNRTTKHQHHPYTCQWLGCKAQDVDAVLRQSLEATRDIVAREKEADKPLDRDIHMGSF